jgi:hypothetical protein
MLSVLRKLRQSGRYSKKSAGHSEGSPAIRSDRGDNVSFEYLNQEEVA